MSAGSDEDSGLTRLIQWVGKHPGYIVLGAVMIAFLSMQPSSPKPQDQVHDSAIDDVPLFI